MKILFLTDNFPPEVNAPAVRTYEHCREWVRLGAEVTVVTCAPNFPQGKVYKGYRNSLYSKEKIQGIDVVRVWTYITANEGFFKRILDFISFSVSSFFAGLFIDADVIVATSPQFFTALSGRTLSFFKRRPWVMEVRDLWPESVKAVGAAKSGWALRYFECEEMWCYKSAKKLIVVTDTFKDKIVARGIDPSKISVIKNGIDRSEFYPMQKDQELIAELGLSGKVILGYIGTHGMAHKLDFILRCARSLLGTKYHFLLIGAGAEKERLLKLKQELDCSNVTMLDPVPKRDVYRYISILDIALINLKKSDLFTSVIPSKIFENAAMSIPILMGVEGEAKALVEQYHAGLCFEPENESDFMSKLQALDNPQLYQELQEGGIRLAEQYDRKALAKSMYEELKQVL
ncbi:glycosyltransferase family 4 protein [Porphyromonas gingivalis]|uniref:glycosyltransferase family 4 protein n=1 Tax=Porphyromonas gingivalis TaxID=837 RepID=UPI000979EAC3|nr:glycosyltransferase family 4 protein [Porphyromonas gingivalis]SJL27952.1 Putative teichuronic acid biosynthesis glycosyltransferase TuaH [Porphyromonas gingivalis]